MPISKKRKIKANTNRIQKLKDELRQVREERAADRVQYDSAVALLSDLRKQCQKLIDKREEWRKSFYLDRNDVLRLFDDLRNRTPVECFAILAEKNLFVSKTTVDPYISEQPATEEAKNKKEEIQYDI